MKQSYIFLIFKVQVVYNRVIHLLGKVQKSISIWVHRRTLLLMSKTGSNLKVHQEGMKKQTVVYKPTASYPSIKRNELNETKNNHAQLKRPASTQITQCIPHLYKMCLWWLGLETAWQLRALFALQRSWATYLVNTSRSRFMEKTKWSLSFYTTYIC